MKVFIAGIDGYLGWSFALYLAMRGYEVSGCDSELRRDMVAGVGSKSVIPIASMAARRLAFKKRFGVKLTVHPIDLRETQRLRNALADFEPDAVVHLAENPSAPYSMIDATKGIETQNNNILGSLSLLFAMKDTCPDAHLVKLGTMGEYGTPNIDIPEGFFEIEYRGRKATLPFPRNAGSIYHLTKVHDSENARFACRVWGMRSTDIMQGVVFGTHIEEMGDDPDLRTRFDVDECFGTAINRYCACAIAEHPLTLFGAGGQKRGFLPLKDSMQCLKLAIDNPPDAGEYRVFNQFEQVYNITELARMVRDEASALGRHAKVCHYENPRYEDEEHYYNPDHEHLLNLGYVPTTDIRGEIRAMLKDLLLYQDRIDDLEYVLVPQYRWDGTHKKSEIIKEDTGQ